MTYALNKDQNAPFWFTSPLKLARIAQVELDIHVFQLSEDGAVDAEEEDEEVTPAYSEWQLPAQAFSGLWDSLVYEQAQSSPSQTWQSAFHPLLAAFVKSQPTAVNM